MSQSTTVSATPPYALIGSTARLRTVAVPWKPLAWMYGSTGPRREPVDGRRRTVARIVWPTAYVLLTTTSTFPLGTVVGRRRSLTGAPVRTGDAPPHEARAAAAMMVARSRMPLRLFRAAAEKHLLEIRKSCAQTADEEDANEEAAEPGDEADDDVERTHPLRADESRGAHDRYERVGGEEADHKGEKDHDPGHMADSGDPREEECLGPGLGPDAVHHANAARGRRAVRRGGE